MRLGHVLSLGQYFRHMVSKYRWVRAQLAARTGRDTAHELLYRFASSLVERYALGAHQELQERLVLANRLDQIAALLLRWAAQIRAREAQVWLRALDGQQARRSRR